ncbi:MAG: hypothetical protein ACTHJN_19295 [Ginsengibacter sp.]
MRYTKLTIPVTTPVRKYIESKNPSPIKLISTNTIGSIIYSILENYNSTQNKKVLNTRVQLLTDRVTMLLPRNDHVLYSKGIQLKPERLLSINNFFERMIWEELFSLCAIYRIVGFSQRQAIEDFAFRNNIIIGKDITYDALKQAIFRNRKNLKEISENKDTYNRRPRLSPFKPGTNYNFKL